MSKDGDAWKVIVSCCVFGGVFLVRGFRHFRVKRKIEDLPTSKIGTAAQGLVEFQGQARVYGGRGFVALDGTPVVYSQIQVEYYQSGKNAGWKTKWSYAVGDRFLIEDSSGVAHVIVKGADFFLEQETTLWNEVPRDQKVLFLSSAGRNIGNPSRMDSGSWRIVERKITEGESILVIGKFKTRAEEPEVTIFDPLTGSERKIRSSGGLMKDQVHPLLIADGTQDQVLKRVHWGLLGMVLGALFLTVGILMTLSKLGL
jgi:hypothetical protein